LPARSTEKSALRLGQSQPIEVGKPQLECRRILPACQAKMP
jgi:hypothetical protein